MKAHTVSIKRQIAVGLAVLAFALFAGQALIIVSVNSMNEDIEEIFGIWFQGENLMLEADRGAYQAYLAMSQLFIPAVFEDKAKKQELIKFAEERLVQLREPFNKFIVTAGDRLKGHDKEITTFRKSYEDAKAALAVILNVVKGAPLYESLISVQTVLLKDFDATFKTMREQLALLSARASTEAMARHGNTLETKNRILMIMLVYMLLIAVCAIGLYVFINLRIVAPLRRLSDLLADIARGEGDLTRQLTVKGRDEIGRAAGSFNQFVETLNGIVGRTQRSAENLKATGQDLASNMQQTAAAVNQISANIDSVKQMVVNQSASVSETSSTIEQIVRNIESLNAQIETQAANVTQSSASIEEMVANLHSISTNLDKVGGTIDRLNKASETGKSRLAGVTATIKDISNQSESLLETNKVIANVASQTNLLAMNAAIEAAHAGSAGRGFAVVADEIRNLAERSTQQSKGVAKDLKGVKSSIDAVVVAAHEAELAFEEVLGLVGSVSQLEEEVKQAMSEQATGSRQVLDGLSQINEITSQVKNGSNEMAGGSTVMLKEMSRMLELTQQVQHSMDEIASGTGEINTAINAVSDLTVKNADDIGVLIMETSRFKIKTKEEDAKEKA